MTETHEETLDELDELQEALDDQVAAEEAEETQVPEVENCEIAFSINVSGVSNLTEAVNVAAIQLMRFGLDAFYVEVTDSDTDDVYIVHNGTIVSFEDVEADFEDLKADIDASTAALEAEDDEREALDAEDAEAERVEGEKSEPE